MSICWTTRGRSPPGCSPRPQWGANRRKQPGEGSLSSAGSPRPTLGPNPFAQRELRLSGKYRVLFNLDVGEQTVTIVLVGEKVGNRLVVQGKEFTAHHED